MSDDLSDQMRLSRRIYKIADKVLPGETAADIGTDHGYVPMILMRDNISPRVIMSDISEGSLAKARETFRSCGIEAARDSFRVGDGLQTIAYGETDVVIIGGLGGFTIIDILEHDPDKSRSFHKFILQPRKHSGNLRYYLYTRGWDIISEDLAPEGKFVCEIITCVPSGVKDRAPMFPEDDIRWKYPEAIIESDPSLAAQRIGWKISSIDEQIGNLKRSSADSTDIIEKLISDRYYLTGLISKGNN